VLCLDQFDCVAKEEDEFDDDEMKCINESIQLLYSVSWSVQSRHQHGTPLPYLSRWFVPVRILVRKLIDFGFDYSIHSILSIYSIHSTHLEEIDMSEGRRVRDP
jgi:hypothetical protein